MLRPLILASLLAGCGGGSPAMQPDCPAPDSPEMLGEPAPQPAAEPEPPGKPKPRGYDAMLTGYAYPYRVQYFETTAQLQTLRMAYMVAEPSSANGKTVTLLHGKNFSGAYWKTTADRLVEAGYRVVMPDQVGFGKSSKPLDFQYSFHALAELTARLLDSIGANRSAVVGHSMGGMLATRFALMYPKRATKLVLANPIGLEDWKRTVPYVTVDVWTERNLKATPAGIKAYMQKSYFAGQWRPAYDALVDIQAGWAVGPDKHHIARVSALHYDMIFTQPVVHEFRDVRVPTLLVIGQRDRTALGKGDVPEEVAATLGDYPKLGRAAKQAIPDAKLVELDDVGHVPQVEAYDAWMKALEGFLSE